MQLGNKSYLGGTQIWVEGRKKGEQALCGSLAGT